MANRSVVVLATAENHASRGHIICKFAARSTAQSGKIEYFQIRGDAQKAGVSEFFTDDSKTEIVAVLKERLRIHEGETVRLAFDDAHCHFFDPQSGERIATH